ncbi:MAG: hypothetical protein L0H93_11505 [Nocardioides sp.]|nr:hypothetical protein [Nocardioides sp.]
MPSDYRLAPQFAARLLGLTLIVLGLLVFVATMIVVLFSAPVMILNVTVVVAVIGIFALGWVFKQKSWVVRTTPEGYVVKWVRGAGTKQARWLDVESLATDTVAGSPCVVIRLRDGRTTTIPVEVIAADRERFVSELQDRLEAR